MKNKDFLSAYKIFEAERSKRERIHVIGFLIVCVIMVAPIITLAMMYGH